MIDDIGLRTRKRGISTYIAVLLLVILAVAAGILIYAYTLGYLGGYNIGSQNQAIQIQSIAESEGQLWIYIKNIGQGTVKIDHANPKSQIYINDAQYDPLKWDTFPTTDIISGNTIKIIISSPLPTEWSGRTIKLKIITVEGVIAETSFKIVGVTGGATQATTTLVLSASTLTVGQSTTGTATVSPPAATGQVQFQTSSDGSTWNDFGGVKTLSGGSTISDAYAPAAVGVYYMRAVYLGDATYAGSTSNVAQITVSSAGVTQTTTTLVLSASTITVGQSTTGTATVSPSAATGQVLFQTSSDGVNWNNFGALKPLSGGSATSDAYAPAATGVYYMRAMYLGDATYAGSTSNVAQITVSSAGVTQTTTTLVLSASTIAVGQSTTGTATVSPSAATGQVQFQTSPNGVNWSDFGGLKTLSGGVATSDAYAPGAVGVYYMKAVYQGGATYSGSTSNIAQVTVSGTGVTQTTTTLVLTASTIHVGQSTLGIASVSPSAATGQVRFQTSSDGVNWSDSGSAKNLISGSATSDAYAPAAVGVYYMRAVYLGDATYSGSTSNVAQVTVSSTGITQTTTTLVLSAPTLTVGQSTTGTATVSPSAATGQVQFQTSSDGVNWSGFGSAKTLSGGSTTSDAYAPGVVGVYYMRAVYLGDATYSGSTSNVAQVTVSSTGVTQTTTTLVLSASTIAVGQSTTGTATVSPSTATGQVQFQTSSNGVNWSDFGGLRPLSGGSATSNAYAPGAVGVYYMRAVYLGDATYSGSTSNVAQVTVSSTGITQTTTTLVLSPSTITVGQSTTGTATVSPSGATGQVQFQTSSNGVNWSDFGGTRPLTGGSATSNAYAPAAVGVYYMRAVYLGDATYSGSTSNIAQLTVSTPVIQTTTTLVLSASTITVGQSTTGTATVSPSAATGQVQFQTSSNGVNWSDFGSAKTLTGGSAASDTYTPADAGVYYMRAVYLGAAPYSGSTSNVAQLTVTAAVLDTDFDNSQDWDAGWDDYGNPPWRRATGEGYGGTTAVTSDSTDDGPFTSDNLDASQASVIQVTFKYRVYQTETNDLELLYCGIQSPYSGGDSPDFHSLRFIGVPGSTPGAVSLGGGWYQLTITITRASYPDAFTRYFRFRFESSLTYSGGVSEQVWVDDIIISMDP